VKSSLRQFFRLPLSKDPIELDGNQPLVDHKPGVGKASRI
jgi:hypothetical protein